MKHHIPNFLTCLSLFSGCIAIVMIGMEQLQWVPYLVWISAFFDFVDGLAARLLQVSSPMGKELDSLSDMVSFGVVPGFFVFKLLAQNSDPSWLAFGGFFITICSALRLAKFNIDDRQSDQFIGLPTPANAIFITGLIWLPASWNVLSMPVLLAIAMTFSLLLISELPLLALKFKSYAFASNTFRYIVIGSTLLLLILFGLEGISLSIVLYLIISLLSNQIKPST